MSSSEPIGRKLVLDELIVLLDNAHQEAQIVSSDEGGTKQYGNSQTVLFKIEGALIAAKKIKFYRERTEEK